ncbi:ArsR/SmtB family transcription factor [Neomicrococcus lactis]
MPLYESKANLFKSLGHPARIRVLELLQKADGHTAPVSHLLDYMDIEPSYLSQHLKVLHKNRLVKSQRERAHV